MIRIVSRKVLRFYNPNTNMLRTVLRKIGEGDDAENVPIQVLDVPNPRARVSKENRDNPAKDLFFDTIPGERGAFGEPQIAPDWIKQDTKDKRNITTFENAIRDGMLIEVSFVASTETEQKQEKEPPAAAGADKFPVVEPVADLPAGDNDLVEQAQSVAAADAPSGGRRRR